MERIEFHYTVGKQLFQVKIFWLCYSNKFVMLQFAFGTPFEYGKGFLITIQEG